MVEPFVVKPRLPAHCFLSRNKQCCLKSALRDVTPEDQTSDLFVVSHIGRVEASLDPVAGYFFPTITGQGVPRSV